MKKEAFGPLFFVVYVCAVYFSSLNARFTSSSKRNW